MVISRGKRKHQYLLYAIASVIWSFALIVMCLWLYAHGLKRIILILPVMQLFALILMLFIVYRRYSLDYSVDASGIRVFSGSRTFKTASWQEFAYVGTLNSNTGKDSMIVCSTELPTEVNNGSFYNFPRKDAIMIDFTAEDEQRMRPYFKGAPITETTDL